MFTLTKVTRLLFRHQLAGEIRSQSSNYKISLDTRLLVIKLAVSCCNVIQCHHFLIRLILRYTGNRDTRLRDNRTVDVLYRATPVWRTETVPEGYAKHTASSHEMLHIGVLNTRP